MKVQKFLSTAQYAKNKGISKMQVTRLIRAGKIPAEKVGNSWMIFASPTDALGGQSGNSTSLQTWNKIIENQFGKSLKIERVKDRELIFSRMHSLGLPHEQSFCIPAGELPTKKSFKSILERIGFPYWISAVPNPEKKHLNRQTKLNIKTVDVGWDFINQLVEKQSYKFILIHYPLDPDFKGTCLVSHQGKGLAEFVNGDRHIIMTRGFTKADPMIFDNKKIYRFSSTVSKIHQKNLFNLVKGIPGHFEFQRALADGKRQITFFDYNTEGGYTEIDRLWQALANYSKKKKTPSIKKVYGFPSTLGKVKGPCLITHHQSAGTYQLDQKNNYILVSDTVTPRMVPLLKKAMAVVTELCGVTTHVAIVCRQLKIPTIVGADQATAKLRNNQIATIDATSGEISIE